MSTERMIVGTVCIVVLATTAAMIAYAPAHGVNEVVAGYVYRVVDVMLGAILGASMMKGKT
jgi:hypothetical protein